MGTLINIIQIKLYPSRDLNLGLCSRIRSRSGNHYTAAFGHCVCNSNMWRHGCLFSGQEPVSEK